MDTEKLEWIPDEFWRKTDRSGEGVDGKSGRT